MGGLWDPEGTDPKDPIRTRMAVRPPPVRMDSRPPVRLPGPPTRDKHWIQSLDVAQVECLGVALHMRVVCQSQRKDDGSRRTTREPVVSDRTRIR